ncbi:MAG: hypothetical protein V4663_05860 [Bacteroidota bacterium]
MSGIAGIGGIGGNTGTIGKLSVVENVEVGAGAPVGGAGGGAGAAGIAGITPRPVIVGVGGTSGADNTCTGGATGTVSAGAFTAFTPIVGPTCGVGTGTGVPLFEALFLEVCALAPIDAATTSNIKINFFITVVFI